MKSKMLFLSIAIIFFTSGYSQCDTKNVLTATGAEILSDDDEVMIRDTLRTTTVKYDSKVIEIISGRSTLYGKVDSIFCSWKDAFREGDTYIRGMLYYDNGEQWVARLSINGKDGKLTLLVDIDHPNANRMRFVLDSFKETK